MAGITLIEFQSSEDESDDEEEKIEFRPVFVPKYVPYAKLMSFASYEDYRRSRVTVEERVSLAQDSEEALKKREQQVEERRRESHNLVAQTIRRELAESKFRKEILRFMRLIMATVAEEKQEDVNEVDDTDGLDPAAEFEAWRLRELARIKKEKEAELAQEQEREEVERRRAMPEEQRMQEDVERAKKLREEKPKGQQKFLQKYWHKGAFHQVIEIILASSGHAHNRIYLG